MSDRQNNYPLGQYATADELPHLLGQEGIFADVNHSSSENVKPELSGMSVVAMWVRNGSGGALLPSTGVVWSTTTGEVGIEVSGAGGADVDWAGIVDPHLPAAGVPNGSHFWIIRNGPAKVIHDGDDTIVAGDLLVAGADGKVDKYSGAATAATEPISVVGRAIETPSANTDGTKFRALVNFRF